MHGLAYLAVGGEDGDTRANDKVDEVALTLGQVLVLAVAEGRHRKPLHLFLVPLKTQIMGVGRGGEAISGRIFLRGCRFSLVWFVSRGARH